MTTQSIIVYRNPVEAAFWESGIIVPLGGGLGVGFIVFLLLMWIADKLTKRRWQGPNNFVTGAAAVAAVCVGLLTFYWLAI